MQTTWHCWHQPYWWAWESDVCEPQMLYISGILVNHSTAIHFPLLPTSSDALYPSRFTMMSGYGIGKLASKCLIILSLTREHDDKQKNVLSVFPLFKNFYSESTNQSSFDQRHTTVTEHQPCGMKLQINPLNKLSTICNSLKYSNVRFFKFREHFFPPFSKCFGHGAPAGGGFTPQPKNGEKWCYFPDV